MASKGIESGAFLIVLVLMLFSTAATAQSGCTAVLVGLYPCLNYVSGNSSTPSSSCCSQLANVVQSQPKCLCALLNGGGTSLGVSMNQTLALSLPGACNVQTPPVSRCNAANGPIATPSSSPPVDDKPATPSTQSKPAVPAGGSKTVPTTATGTSDATFTRMQLHLTLFIIFIASFAANPITF